MITSFPVVVLCSLFARFITAQDTIVNPTTAAASATPLPSAFGYSYVGCWNETVGIANSAGVRALSMGNSTASNLMTTSMCLEFCSSGSGGETTQFAGLEYGREW